MSDCPTIIILAGANGSGKTTAARGMLADFLHVHDFVNADDIARGLSAFDSESVAFQAGRVMLDRLKVLSLERRSFAFETTLAGRNYARWVQDWKAQGYRIVMLYVWLNDAALNVARVAQRVRLGGHHIPEAVIRQRYSRSVRNFFSLFRPLIDEWKVYDNSVDRGEPILTAQGVGATSLTIADERRWSAFEKVGGR